MAIVNPRSPDILCEEILAEARREGEKLLQHAQLEAASLLSTAKKEAEAIRLEQRKQAGGEARRRKDVILATVAVETGRLRSARIEVLLESIHEEIRHRLLAREISVRETVVTLAAEAIRQMRANQFVLKISSKDQSVFGGDAAQEIAQQAGRPALKVTFSPDGAINGGGVVVYDVEGFQMWDNRLLSRLDRLWPDLRGQIAIQTSLIGESQAKRGEA